jgi:hypothetical protein
MGNSDSKKQEVKSTLSPDEERARNNAELRNSRRGNKPTRDGGLVSYGYNSSSLAVVASNPNKNTSKNGKRSVKKGDDTDYESDSSNCSSHGPKSRSRSNSSSSDTDASKTTPTINRRAIDVLVSISVVTIFPLVQCIILIGAFLLCLLKSS